MKAFKHAELSGSVIGCAMKVHRTLGPGFPEIIYRRCLVIELEKLGMNCEVEIEKDIIYDGKFVGNRRLDLIVNNLVIVELKAVTNIESLFYSQLLNYLSLFKIEIGLLLNFGKTSLEFKRIANCK